MKHDCHSVETGNKAFRFLYSAATEMFKIKTREQSKRGKPANETEPF